MLLVPTSLCSVTMDYVIYDTQMPFEKYRKKEVTAYFFYY